MKAAYLLSSTILALIATASFGAETLVPDLKTIPSGKGWKGATGIISLTEKNGAPAVAAKGTGVVWLDGFEFTNGVIEFDGKGKEWPATETSWESLFESWMKRRTMSSIYARSTSGPIAQRRLHSCNTRRILTGVGMPAPREARSV